MPAKRKIIFLMIIIFEIIIIIIVYSQCPHHTYNTTHWQLAHVFPFEVKSPQEDGDVGTDKMKCCRDQSKLRVGVGHGGKGI